MSTLTLVDVALVEDDDAQVVRGHLDGDPGSFDVLYRRYFPRLVRMLARRIGDNAAAEDLAQETLLRALNNLHRFDLERPMWPWLKTIATNLSADHLRRRGREPIVDVDTTEGTTGDEVAASPADDLVTAIEDRRVLALALEQVPSRQRVALGLRYLDDWSADEAADFLGVTRNGFDQLLFRARARLRAEYDALTGELSAATRLVLLPFLPALQGLRGLIARVRARTTGIESGLPGVTGSSDVLAQVIAAAGLVFVVSVGAIGIPASASPDTRQRPESPTAQQLRDEAAWVEVARTTAARRPIAIAIAAPADTIADVNTHTVRPAVVATVTQAPTAAAPAAEVPVTPPATSDPEQVVDRDLDTRDVAPSAPRTRAHLRVGKDDDGNQTLNSRIDSRLGGYAPTSGSFATVHCDGAYGAATCDTYDQADEALPETAEPPPVTDVSAEPEL